MFNFLNEHLENRGKIVTWLLELLYSFIILYLAAYFYGKAIDTSELVLEIETISTGVFIDIIGILVCFLFASFLSTTLLVVLSTFIDFLFRVARYLFQRSSDKGIKNYSDYSKKREKRITSKAKRASFFLKLDDRRYEMLKDSFLKRKPTRLGIRVMVILFGCLLIGLFGEESSFPWFVYVLLGIGIALAAPLFMLVITVQEVVELPLFFDNIEDERKRFKVLDILKSHDNCFQVVDGVFFKENHGMFSFKLNEKGKQLGHIHIVDKKFAENWITAKLVWKALLIDGQNIMLIDMLDLISARFDNHENLRIVKTIDANLIQKEMFDLFYDEP